LEARVAEQFVVVDDRFVWAGRLDTNDDCDLAAVEKVLANGIAEGSEQREGTKDALIFSEAMDGGGGIVRAVCGSAQEGSDGGGRGGNGRNGIDAIIVTSIGAEGKQAGVVFTIRAV
jgi:hypothetical protein